VVVAVADPPDAASTRLALTVGVAMAPDSSAGAVDGGEAEPELTRIELDGFPGRDVTTEVDGTTREVEGDGFAGIEGTGRALDGRAAIDVGISGREVPSVLVGVGTRGWHGVVVVLVGATLCVCQSEMMVIVVLLPHCLNVQGGSVAMCLSGFRRRHRKVPTSVRLGVAASRPASLGLDIALDCRAKRVVGPIFTPAVERWQWKLSRKLSGAGNTFPVSRGPAQLP
jgi:hypothetical protein